VAESAASESEDGIGAAIGPKHSRLFQSRSDDRFATGLNDARASEEMLRPEFRTTHALGVAGKELGFSG